MVCKETEIIFTFLLVGPPGSGNPERDPETYLSSPVGQMSNGKLKIKCSRIGDIAGS